VDGRDEERILALGIGKKYQTSLLPFPVPSLVTTGTGEEREHLAEDLELPAGKRWVGVFLPSSSRREIRNHLMDLAALADAVPEVHLVCLVPTLRLGDARSLLVRLRLGDRFHIPGDLQLWEKLVSHLETAVFPRGGLTALAAALLTLGVPRPVWTSTAFPWMHLLPGDRNPHVRFGQAYRMNEEIGELLTPGIERTRPEGVDRVPDEIRPDAVAERLETVYRDVLAERIGPPL
jgi:hypothetical protein